MARESIKLLHAALDVVEGPDNEIILRGAIDPSSLHMLRTGEYQREVLPLATIRSLVKAFETGSVPDVDLGMRGGNYQERGGAFYLSDPVYIVDGLQRVTAAIQLLQKGTVQPRIGATVHFNTSEDWERERFRILNAERVKLSSNVLLRNMRYSHPVVEMLLTLTTTDRSFVGHGKVCWGQRVGREHLITALTFLRTVASLHAHVGPGRGSNYSEIANGLSTIVDRATPAALTANAKAFFALVDEAWGIKSVAFKEGATHIKSTFLRSLATLLSRHEDFWKGTRLFVDADLTRKIKAFPVTDPSVRSLSAAGSTAEKLLYALMVDHVNSGKRTKRLTIRPEVAREVEAEQEIIVPAAPVVPAAALKLEEVK